jgi:hypothetical protein
VRLLTICYKYLGTNKLNLDLVTIFTSGVFIIMLHFKLLFGAETYLRSKRTGWQRCQFSDFIGSAQRKVKKVKRNINQFLSLGIMGAFLWLCPQCCRHLDLQKTFLVKYNIRMYNCEMTLQAHRKMLSTCSKTRSFTVDYLEYKIRLKKVQS